MLDKLSSDLDRFWPEYLAHHSHGLNRDLHDAGDAIVLVSAGLGALTLNPLILGAGVACGYGLAFAGHYLVEGNEPATLRHPLLAGISNWRMFFLALRGDLAREMAKHGVVSRGPSRFGVEALRRKLLPVPFQRRGDEA